MERQRQNEEKGDLAAFVTSLTNSALCDLRLSHGSMRATKRAILRYFQQGLGGGLPFDALLEELFFKPTLTTSVIARIGYSGREIEALVSWLKGLTLEEVASFTEGQPHQ